MKKAQIRIDTNHIKQNQKHYIIFGVLLAMAVFLIVIALIIDSQRSISPASPSINEEQSQKEQQKKIAAEEAEAKKIKESMLNNIKKEMKLPTDEEPIFATVDQKEQLQKQNFFKKSQNGDKVLLYPKHKRVILYRPSTKKIIAVSHLQFETAVTPTLTVSLSPSPQEADDDTNP